MEISALQTFKCFTTLSPFSPNVTAIESYLATHALGFFSNLIVDIKNTHILLIF